LKVKDHGRPCQLAPVTWAIIAEIFPTRIHGSAISIAATALWTGSFTLAYTFPLAVSFDARSH